MPIEFRCSGCDKTLRVPDHAAGLTVNCPECAAGTRVPETHLQKGEQAFHSPETRYRDEPAPFPSPGSRMQTPGLETSEPEGEARRQCPMCGEMIYASAMKCRYCGEVFDETLRRAERVRQANLASRLSRLGAVLLDGILIVIVMVPGFLLMFAGGAEPQWEGPGLLVMLACIGVFAIIQMVLLSTRGQTLGKMAAGVRIVRYEDGGEVGFGKAVFMRAIVPGMIGGIPLIGPFFSLLDPLFIFGEERRCIHDLIAGTKVVNA